MKKILIVVDMQNDFIDGALGTPEAVAILPRVKAKVNEALRDGTEIIATLDTHETNYLKTNEGKHLPYPHCIRNTDGYKISAELGLNETNCFLLPKPSFGSTQLPDIVRVLRDRSGCHDEELEIELAGLCTDICVISNALILKANFPEAKITLDASCCAGVTPRTHQAALDVMKCCQIDVYGE